MHPMTQFSSAVLALDPASQFRQAYDVATTTSTSELTSTSLE